MYEEVCQYNVSMKKHTAALGVNTYTAATSAGIFVSYTKKPTTMNTEITSGTSTVADAHPEEEPDVTAKMNKISATRRYTQSISSRKWLLHRAYL